MPNITFRRNPNNAIVNAKGECRKQIKKGINTTKKYLIEDLFIAWDKKYWRNVRGCVRMNEINSDVVLPNVFILNANLVFWVVPEKCGVIFVLIM